MTRVSAELKARFWKYVNKKGLKHPILKTRCWLWTGTLSTKEYGVLTYKGKQLKAHRIAWKLETGNLPANVLHKCDNPPCVRYSHLFEGTKTDNAADRDAKNRQSKGESRHNAKLTAEKVIKLRKLYATGLYIKEELAAMFGICGTNVGRIVRKEIWRHV